ncbi:hypothetical protein [Novosphingobium naphthalenivorans]|uniref:hypothetical protein n=1 Tax=Novosphingobium naphthalenivorans TaxID=273168 RepID=UPI00082AE648|nr:hypothetical protein [Novosphingobium naphthalenivorans]
MAAGDLHQDDLSIAFTFSRSEAAVYTDAAGAAQTAAVDAPRFDHDGTGSARGLLMTAGSDLGTQDRIAIDPLMLPEAMVAGPRPVDREATVFHAFVALGVDPWAVERRAWYTRNAPALIDGLLSQQGHHLEIGVITGFRANLGGYVRLRGKVWTLATGIAGNAAGAALTTDAAGTLPLIVAGAEAP